jgi:hypothetical protein
MVNTLAVDNEAKQTIEALQAELKKTKERLQAVEELKGQAGMQSQCLHFFLFSCISFGSARELLPPSQIPFVMYLDIIYLLAAQQKECI